MEKICPLCGAKVRFESWEWRAKACSNCELLVGAPTSIQRIEWVFGQILRKKPEENEKIE